MYYAGFEYHVTGNKDKLLHLCTVPDTPHIEVAKCSRSTSSVVLVLDVPSQLDNDVVDGYRVFYTTDQDRPIDVWVSLSNCMSG